jgi:hypothetical protein
MRQVTFQLVERVKNEATRLAAAAGAEGNNSPIFQLVEDLEKGLRHLLAVAQWGVDAHPSICWQDLKEAQEILGIKYQ